MIVGMTKAPDSVNIGAPERHHISDLNTHHRNPRLGNVDAIKASMQVSGVYKPIVVNRGTHTGRPMEVLAGNHSLKAMRQLAEEQPEDKRWQNVECWVVDVDDDRASRIVVADNRTADLGGYDDTELLGLLESLDDLEGTGYIEDDLESLRVLLEDIDDDEDDAPGDTWEDGGELIDDNEEGEDEPITEEEYQEEIERLHNKYTHAAKAPIYEPQDETPPPLEELIDTSKTDRLLNLIDRAEGIPDDVKNLLRATAHRHTVINFKKVAEWYAHQPGEVQELAEQQALIILDLNDALQQGYARLTGELRRHALEEAGYDDAHPDPAHRNPHLDLTAEDESIRERARTRSSAHTEEVDQ